jgi:aminopeptidase-like protein
VNKDHEKSREIEELDLLLERMFPIARSLTGSGNRKTFEIIQELIPLQLHEYPSGAHVYDWVIPDEWDIRDAFIKDSSGCRVVDYRKCNLHVVGYSEAIHQWMDFEELGPHLHTVKANSTAIPYRTSYYQRDWGFCVTAEQYQNLQNFGGPLEVCIDSSFKKDGGMTVGELLIPGHSSEEYFISTYCCHPSMANDNLSGMLVTTLLARDLLVGPKPQVSWRFIFVPETIGAIAYLFNNEARMKEASGGLVVTTCGGPGPLGYKESFKSNHRIDRAVRLAFREREVGPVRYRFTPDGSDERQYSSPGFRIPVATITKDKYYEYPEYHTSADNLDFVNGDQLSASLEIYRDVVNILDKNTTYQVESGYGEPQLGRRGLYPTTGGALHQGNIDSSVVTQTEIDTIMWILFCSDGSNDLLSIAEQSGVKFRDLLAISERLSAAGLLKRVPLQTTLHP